MQGEGLQALLPEGLGGWQSLPLPRLRRGTEGAGHFPLDCARGAIDTGRRSPPSLPERSQGSDGGDPLTRTADIFHDSSHTTRLHTHRQARFPHGRIKCCSNVLDVRDRHRKVTPRPQGQPFHGEPDMHRHAPSRSWKRQHPSQPHDPTGTAEAAPGGTPAKEPADHHQHQPS